VSLPPRWVPPQLCQLVGTAPSGPQWLHEIKLDGFRMSARIERGSVQLLTRTGLDWSDKYPSVVEALAKVRANAAYLDGELAALAMPTPAATAAPTRFRAMAAPIRRAGRRRPFFSDLYGRAPTIFFFSSCCCRPLWAVSLRRTISATAASEALSGWPPSNGGAGSYSIPS
jgi:hypothetical protein